MVPRNGDVLMTGADRTGDDVTGDADVTGAATAAGFAAASTSSRRTRPPIPDHLIEERLTPSSEASFLTIGVT